MNCAILDEYRFKLRDSRRSLRRAWYWFQVLRIWLEEIGEAKPPPAGRRKCIATEGELLAEALEQTFRNAHARFDQLANAAESMRPYFKLIEGDAGFPGAQLNLNRALDGFLRPDQRERVKRAQRARERIAALGQPPA